MKTYADRIALLKQKIEQLLQNTQTESSSYSTKKFVATILCLYESPGHYEEACELINSDDELEVDSIAIEDIKSIENGLNLIDKIAKKLIKDISIENIVLLINSSLFGFPPAIKQALFTVYFAEIARVSEKNTNITKDHLENAAELVNNIYANNFLEALLSYFSLAYALLHDKSLDDALSLVTELKISTQKDIALPFDLFKEDALKLYCALCAAINSCELSNKVEGLQYPFIYKDFPLKERFQDDNAEFKSILKNAAATVFKFKNLTAHQKITVLTVFQIISASNYRQNVFFTPEALAQAKVKARRSIADCKSVEKYGKEITTLAQDIIAEKQKFLTLKKIEIKNKQEELKQSLTKGCELIDKHYDALFQKILREIEAEFKNARTEALDKAYERLQIGVAVTVVVTYFAPYLSKIVTAQMQAWGVTAAIAEAMAAISAGTVATTTTTAAVTALIEITTQALVATASEAVLSGDCENLDKKIFRRIAVDSVVHASGSLVTNKIPTEIPKGSFEAIKIAAVQGATREAMNAHFQSGKIHASALLGGISSGLGEWFVGTLGKSIAQIGKLKKGILYLDEALRSGTHGVIHGVAQHENPLTSALREATLACLTMFISKQIGQGLKAIPCIFKVHSVREESGEDDLAISLSIHKLYKNNQPEHMMLLTGFDSGSENETDNVDETTISVGTNKRNNAAKNSKLPEVGKARLGRKNGANGKQWFDIEDGQYVGRTDKSKNKIISKALGKKIASSFVVEFKAEHLLTESRTEVYDWGLLTPTYTDNGGRAYFSAELDPAKARITIKAGAEKKIQLILDQGSYEFMQGLGTLDYAIEAYSLNAICKGSVSTERGFDASAKIELGALGPNGNASYKSSRLCFFGLSVGLDADVTAGAGLQAAAGAGITLDKTKQQLRPYAEFGLHIGAGARFKIAPTIGTDPEFAKRYAESYEIAINRQESREFTSKVQAAMEKLDHANPVSFWSRLANNMQRSTYEEILESQQQRNHDYARYSAGSFGIRKP